MLVTGFIDIQSSDSRSYWLVDSSGYWHLTVYKDTEYWTATLTFCPPLPHVLYHCDNKYTITGVATHSPPRQNF